MKKKFVALKTFVFLQRRYGRAVDRGGLENRYTEMYRGFESLCLRKSRKVMQNTMRLSFLNFHLKPLSSYSETRCILPQKSYSKSY